MPDTMADTEKSRENRLRRAAQRQGLVLRKCPRRDPWATGYGTYMLVDPSRNIPVLALLSAFGASLDDVEEYLHPATTEENNA